MDIHITQGISFTFSIITLIFVFLWRKKKPEKAGWAIPVIIFLVYNIAFHLIVWSGVLRPRPLLINQISSGRNLVAVISYSVYWIAKYYGVFNGHAKDIRRLLLK